MKKLIFVLAAAFALTACDRISGKHEVVQVGNQTFRLNKVTGETMLIDGAFLIPLKETTLNVSGDSFNKAKTWPEQSINDLPEVKFVPRTKYRDGVMQWKVHASPFSSELEQAYNSIQGGALHKPVLTFVLYDNEEFETAESIELKIQLASKKVSLENEVLELNWSGSLPMTLEAYSSISFASIQWAENKNEFVFSDKQEQLVLEQHSEIVNLPREIEHNVAPNLVSNMGNKFLEGSYLAAWRSKIEEQGNIDYSREPRIKGLSGATDVEVVIRADGALVSLSILKSSGHIALDDFALLSIAKAAPYPPFSEAMRQAGIKQLRFERRIDYSGERSTKEFFR